MNNREAFEAAYRSSSISIDDSYFKLDDNGDYMAISTYNAWAGYQLGCQALPSQAQQQNHIGDIGEIANKFDQAAAEIEPWGIYAPRYFQEKHDLAGCIAVFTDYADKIRNEIPPAPEGE
jgi:hypothetical protein